MDLSALINLLEHRAVRDLAWTIGSPPLVRCLDPQILDSDFASRALVSAAPHLLALDKAPDPLQDYLAERRSERLGEYFERLVHFWITEICELEVLGHNIVVRDQKRTVGELDLILDGDEPRHWEVAVKFYLGYAGENPGWIGPNPADRFAYKWTKFRDRQLVLARTPSAEETLRELGIPAPTRSEGLFKGYLFESLNPRWHVPLPPDASPEHGRGWWAHAHELGGLDIEGDAYVELSRVQWLAPAHARDHQDVRPTRELVELRGRRHPVLIALLRDDVEISRGFVVPDDWPRVF